MEQPRSNLMPSNMDFEAKRHPKTFQCCFENANPEDMLDFAFSAINKIKDASSGKPEWQIANKLPQQVPGASDGWYHFYTATYPLANFTRTIALTCAAVAISEARGRAPSRRRPQMPDREVYPVARHERADRPSHAPRMIYLCEFTAHFEGGGWEIPGIEQSVDYAMLALSEALRAQYSTSTGWQMVKGRWQIAHRFQANESPAFGTYEAESAARKAEEYLRRAGLMPPLNNPRRS
jgi:hypothetical protein